MSQKERNEWIERAKERVLRNAKETDTYARDIMDLYDETVNQLENEINAMFQKYARITNWITRKRKSSCPARNTAAGERAWINMWLRPRRIPGRCWS